MPDSLANRQVPGSWIQQAGSPGAEGRPAEPPPRPGYHHGRSVYCAVGRHLIAAAGAAAQLPVRILTRLARLCMAGMFVFVNWAHLMHSCLLRGWRAILALYAWVSHLCPLLCVTCCTYSWLMHCSPCRLPAVAVVPPLQAALASGPSSDRSTVLVVLHYVANPDLADGLTKVAIVLDIPGLLGKPLKVSAVC